MTPLRAAAILSLALVVLAPPPAFAAKGSKEAKAAYKKGVAAGNTGKLGDAIKHFAEATRLDRKHDRAWRDLGRAYLFKDRYVEAVAALSHAAALNKRSFNAKRDLGRAYLNLGVPELAVPPLKGALKLAKKKDREEARLLLGTAQVDAAQSEDAVKTFEALLKDNPWNKDALLLLATAQSDAKAANDALVTLEKLIKTDRGDKRAHLLKAEILVEQGKTEAAKLAYGAACELGDRKACLRAR
jgi:protein O-mannosyl-transferase